MSAEHHPRRQVHHVCGDRVGNVGDELLTELTDRWHWNPPWSVFVSQGLRPQHPVAARSETEIMFHLAFAAGNGSL